MKILMIILILAFPLAIYYNYNLSKSNIEIISTEAKSYQIDTLSNRIERIFDSMEFRSNLLITSPSDEVLTNIESLSLWRYTSISIFDENKICLNSLNKLNIGLPIEKITFAPLTSKTVISDPYVVDINHNGNLFVDIVITLDNNSGVKYVVYKLNTNQIQTVIGSSIFTFIQDYKTGLFVHPYVHGLDYKVIKATPETLHYIKEEYTGVQVSLPHMALPSAIEQMMRTDKFDNDKYTYSHINLNKYNWKIIQVSISYMEDYSLILVFGLCIVAVTMLIFILYINAKQITLIGDFMREHLKEKPTLEKEANCDIILQVSKLSEKFAKVQEEMINRIDELKSDNDLSIMEITEEKKATLNTIMKDVLTLKEELDELCEKNEELKNSELCKNFMKLYEMIRREISK